MDIDGKTREELLLELDQALKRISELELSEQKYRQIVQNANSIIMTMDVRGNITFFNRFAQRFFGFYEREVIGKSVVGTIVSETDSSGNDLVNMIKDIVENPERHTVNENDNVRKNGERVRVLWTNQAIIDANGKIKEIVCIGNKVSGS